jgi:hypothetical protein
VRYSLVVIMSLLCVVNKSNDRRHKQIRYSETCLNQTFLGSAFVFRIDRCSVYTGSRFPTVDMDLKVSLDRLYLKFGLYRIPFYAGFTLDMFHCTNTETIKGSLQVNVLSLDS